MAIEFEKQPLRWNNVGEEPSEDLKTNGFRVGYKPAAGTFNFLLNNTSECLTEFQTKLSGVDDKVTQTQSDLETTKSSLETLDSDIVKGITASGSTLPKSSDGIVNITPSNIGAATSTHYHSASQINSGLLPIERGGTGATTVDEAMTNLNVPKYVNLYANESGTNGTVTLSDDVGNYSRLEVTVRPYSGSSIIFKHTNLLDRWDGYFAGNVINMYPTSNGSTELYCAAASINASGTTITFKRNFNGNAVYICRVVGYKNLF